MERLLIRALFLAAAFLLAASDTIQEAPKVQLASELNVDRELVRKCSSFNYEAGALCAERQVFTLYGDARSGCQKYFWCSPDHGACMMACPAGAVFNQACNCCQDAASPANAIDLGTCSSSTVQQPADAAPDATAGPASSAGEESREAARKLLAADPAGQTNTPSSGSSTMASSEDRQQAQARTRARQTRRRQRREAAARAAAAGAVGDDSSDAASSQPQPAKRRMARRSNRASVWNSHGKKYKGAWADRDVVKEPAVRVTTPQQPAAAAQPAAGGSERKLLAAQPIAGAQVASISSRAETSNSNQPAAAAGVRRSPAGSSPTQRSIKMKRMKHLATAAAAAAAAAGDPAEAAATGDSLEWATHGGPQHKFIRQRLRPMDQKSAGKAIDPEDEEAAPFAHALAGESQDAKAAQGAGGAGGAGGQGTRVGGAGGQQRMRMRRNRLARRAAPNGPKAQAPVPAATTAAAPQAAAQGSTAQAPQHA